MISARDTALALIKQNPNTAMLIALDIARIVADERLRLRTKTPTMERADCNTIFAAVCDYYRVTENDLMGRGRSRQHAEARQMTWWILTAKLRWSHERISAMFNRDRTTVSDGLSRAVRFQREFDELCRRLKLSDAELEAAE